MAASGLKYHVAAGIGNQETPNADGSKFQMGVAVDLVNRKYEYGNVIRYSLAADEHGVSSTTTNAHQYGLSHSDQDENSCPSQLIQYGDHAIVGPSTVTGQEGYSEPVRVAGAGHLNNTDSTTWTDGLIYSLDRRSRYTYQLSDPVTVYGTGRAAGWYSENMVGQTVGIQKGYISLNHMGRILYGHNSTAALSNALVHTWENDFSDSDFIGLSAKLPIAYHDNQNNILQGYKTGPAHADAVGPSREFSKYGLFPIRSARYSSPYTGTLENTMDYYNDDASGSATNDIKGVFRYIHKHNDNNRAELAFNTNGTATNTNNDRTMLGLMAGYDHPGGQYKDTAQAFMTSVNGLSTNSGGDFTSRGIFYQPLTRSNADATDARFSKLTGGTNYRMGITYRGNMTDRGSIMNTSYTYAFFQWSPGIRSASGSDENTYAQYYMSTDKLLDGSNANLKAVNTYTTKMVYGTVNSPNIDLVDNINYQALGVVQYSDTTAANLSSRKSGVEQMIFIDNMWLEHEGDITGGTGKGYIEIDHFPEQGTLTVNRHRTNKPTVVKLSDGTSKTLDTTGTNQKFLHSIQCDFLYLKQTEYDKLQDLLRWQDMGHKLTLHPHLPQVPHCLVGELELTNVRKSFWDLTRFSVTFKFIETD